MWYNISTYKELIILRVSKGEMIVKKKQILASLVMLSLLQGSVYAEKITPEASDLGFEVWGEEKEYTDGFELILDRQNNNYGNQQFGLIVGGSGFLNVSGGETKVELITHKNDYEAYGLNIYKEGTLNAEDVTITVNADNATPMFEADGICISYGNVDNNYSATGKTTITVNAQNGAYVNGIVVYNDSGEALNNFKFKDLEITTTGSSAANVGDGNHSNSGINLKGAVKNFEITGDAVIKTTGDKDGWTSGIYLENDASIKLNNTTIEAGTGKNVRGLYVDSSSVNSDGLLKVTVSDAQSDISGIHLLASAGKSTFTGKDVELTVNSIDNGSGFYATDKSEANLSGKLTVNVTSAEGKGVDITDGSKLTGKIADITVIGDGGAAIYVADTNSNASFSDSVKVNAEKAVSVVNGTAVVEKDFISTHSDSLIESTEKGNIDINKTGTGLVQFTGKTTVRTLGVLNMNLTTEGSYWNVTGDSTLTNLKNDTTVDMSADGNGFSTITVNNILNSGGIFNMDIDASKNEYNSDRIYVNGKHEGTHYITLNNIGANTDGAAGTVLVSVNDEQGKFEANDSEGALYWNKYTLDRFDTSAGDEVTAGYNTDWYLKEVEQLDEPTTSVDTILGANALGYHTWRAETDKLMKRMGDLRHNGEDEKGAWFRVRGAEISRDGEASFENKYTVYELGYDEITKKTDRFTRYQGVALSYIDGTSSFARGSGENDGKSIAFYTTEMRNKGHYLDLVFRIADMDSDYKVYDTNGNKITGEPENVGVSLSAEYGRKKVMADNGWYIEPQGQLTVGYFGGDNYRAKYADQYIDVHQSGIPGVLGRIGFNIGRDIDENTNIYLKANLLHEFCGDYDVDMVDSAGNRRTESDTFNDTWFEYGIGAAIKTGKNNHLYFDFEKTAGGDFEKDWAWNAGMRWTF